MNTQLSPGLTFRHSVSSDHPRIISVLKDWWGGRDLTSMVPRLFLEHFCDTSFVIEKEGDLVAFLIGFLSPEHSSEGYIHFSGVHPDYRSLSIGTYLYEHFTQICRENGRNTIRACTSPINRGSILFHTKIGFEIEKGNSIIDGVQVTLDYNRPDDPKVLFKKMF
ncbi:MAG: GNAT family N-acetyltransferase [Deltaproteobacteria bacterium]|jgi:GNAT superfamily N-acetyltransferase|nr:GNAT family N-acetyltransferase [Deltaproteobacteria bacterium]MBT4265565.1 GNAT family N-acetyltransferase [Deltaproteobacteria bacterium]MBT4638126.1 GNAT family N-acetyltransferase [Deltaproteobacteria bacterium]MBT6502413.1 GNAT family N-acetyltransferase [Deltaproteobacteria bacterium]MBT7156042.1 GNAT family N-acetyltransferase [Deltaproteobacteria bacterium]